MNTAKLLLLRAIALLYRETELIDSEESSVDIIQNALTTIKASEANTSLNNSQDVVGNLRGIVVDMITDASENKAKYDKEMLLQQIKLACGNDEVLYESFQDALEKDLTIPVLKRTIINYRKYIGNYFRETQVAKVLSKASYRFNVERDTVTNTNDFINGVVEQLEGLQTVSTLKDPAIINEVDLDNENEVEGVINTLNQQNSKDTMWKTGWQGLNDMLDGGVIPGELFLINAPKHNNKSGFLLSLFRQLVTYNAPRPVEDGKKPLALHISFEDSVEMNLKYLYQALKQEEGIRIGKREQLDPDDVKTYVRSKLSSNGWRVKMSRVDPTQWTYKDIINKITFYESEGFSVQLLAIDYYALLPTTFCVTNGPPGSDIRDLFRRIHNYAASKSPALTILTPHQASPAAKNLLRSGSGSGVAPHNFVKEMQGKGYYDRCSTIDNEIDIGVHLFIVEHLGKSYLSVGWEKTKDRVIPHAKKYMLLPFPEGDMPIPDDINSPTPIHLRKLPTTESLDTDIDLF